MTTPSRILICLVFGLMAVGGVQYASLRDAQRELAKQEAINQNLNSTVSAYKKRAQAADKVRADAQATKERINDAVKANPDWAAGVVPDAVWDSLYGPAAPPAAR